MYWNSAKKTFLSLKLMTRGPSDGSQTAGSVNENCCYTCSESFELQHLSSDCEHTSTYMRKVIVFKIGSFKS